jgi:hypothetical protein
MVRRRFIVDYDEIELVGAFIHREQHYIEIEMLEPYVNWTARIGRTGPSRMNPNSLEGRQGLYWAGKLLIEAYRKLKILDKSFDRILKTYKVLQKERAMIRANIGREGEMICGKLYNEFFHSMFSSTSTGLSASYTERPHIIEILEHYEKTGQRSFKATTDQ